MKPENQILGEFSISLSITENELAELGNRLVEGDYTRVKDEALGAVISHYQTKIEKFIYDVQLSSTAERIIFGDLEECPSCGDYVIELDYCSIKDESVCSSCVEDTW
jgi:formylmethanofuran dehydrogenase subunit E